MKLEVAFIANLSLFLQRLDDNMNYNVSESTLNMKFGPFGQMGKDNLFSVIVVLIDF